MFKQSSPIQGKICSKCKIFRPLVDFNKSCKSPDEHRNDCRECQANYYATHKERWIEYRKQYRKNHPEAIRKAGRKYRAKHLDKLRQKSREYARKLRREHPQKCRIKGRKSALRIKYSLTMSEYQEILKKQLGNCAICGYPSNIEDRYLCVDHNHKTGIIRGLLCNRCNIVLGHVDDDTVILQKMISYIEDHG